MVFAKGLQRTAGHLIQVDRTQFGMMILFSILFRRISTSSKGHQISPIELIRLKKPYAVIPLTEYSGTISSVAERYIRFRVNPTMPPWQN